jgi:hypothetical protein
MNLSNISSKKTNLLAYLPTGLPLSQGDMFCQALDLLRRLNCEELEKLEGIYNNGRADTRNIGLR